MAEQDLQSPQVSADDAANAGTRLRRAREELRLSRADIAARTKIAERHLAAIEEERFGDLASSTYAVGFSRAYARAVGLDEREIAQAVREELDMADDPETQPKPAFEPGDPARVPSPRTAWVAAAGALAVLVGVGVFWGNYIFPAGSLPDLTSDAPPPPSAQASSAVPASAVPTGPVVVTATQEGVWVRISDEAGNQLFQKEMARGESFTVPSDAAGPQLRTARPEALAVTVGGRPVAALPTTGGAVTVPISAAALLASGTPPATPAAARVETTALPLATPAPPPRSVAPAAASASSPPIATTRPVVTATPRAVAAPSPSPAAVASPRPARPSPTPAPAAPKIDVPAAAAPPPRVEAPKVEAPKPAAPVEAPEASTDSE